MINRNTKPSRFAGLILAGIVTFALFTGTAPYKLDESGMVGTVQAQQNIDSLERESSFGTSRFRCSNRTIKGRYAVQGNGWVPNGPPGSPMVPFANVSLMTLDGRGGLVNDITVSRNGQISQNVDNGTYSIGENCKGTMIINISTPPFQLTFDVVVADGGDEFLFIATTPSVVTHEAKRLD